MVILQNIKSYKIPIYHNGRYLHISKMHSIFALQIDYDTYTSFPCEQLNSRVYRHGQACGIRPNSKVQKTCGIY